MTKQIAIGVGGRFHSEHMARALGQAGFQTILCTSLPRSRFRARQNIQNWLWPEMVYRLGMQMGWEHPGDRYKMTAFGRRFQQFLRKQKRWEAVIGWSSFSKEAFTLSHIDHKILVRDSAHIRYQYALLRNEYKRWGRVFPNRDFCLERELAEYELADTILVLSEFARNSFLDAGIAESKIKVVPLGVDRTLFTPLPQKTYRLPLKVIYFGNLTIQKGIPYLLEAANQWNPKQVELYLVGHVEKHLSKEIKQNSAIHYSPPMSQASLAKFIQDKDLFIFPTIHDGFGQTLIQAMSSGLVPIVTHHCGAADCIDGTNGFRIPIRSASAITETIERCLENIPQLYEMRRRAIETAASLSWERYETNIAALFQSPSQPLSTTRWPHPHA